MCESAGKDPDACCVLAYGIYTIVVGVLALLYALYSTFVFLTLVLYNSSAILLVFTVISVGFFLVSVMYIIAGSLLVAGMLNVKWISTNINCKNFNILFGCIPIQGSRNLFRCGKILSYVFPIYTFPLIFTMGEQKVLKNCKFNYVF